MSANFLFLKIKFKGKNTDCDIFAKNLTANNSLFMHLNKTQKYILEEDKLQVSTKTMFNLSDNSKNYLQIINYQNYKLPDLVPNPS